nr:ribosomal protein L6 [Dryopteris crassirhizoma]
MAVSVKSCKPPEVYKGRGTKYWNEILRRKQGEKKQIASYIPGTKLVSNK